jgi:hypothetical protein
MQRLVLSLAIGAIAGSLSLHAQALFPKSLHLTRAIDDPLSGSQTIVEEFLVGNRVISSRETASEKKTVIVDYSTSQITIIERSGSDTTYSISSFDEYA